MASNICKECGTDFSSDVKYLDASRIFISYHSEICADCLVDHGISMHDRKLAMNSMLDAIAKLMNMVPERIVQ